MRFMAQFADENSFHIHWTMYAPSHGYSLCDAHGGCINKSKLKAEKARRQPKTCQQYKHLIEEKFQNTTVEILKDIDKTNLDGPKYRAMQKFHTFDINKKMVRCYFDKVDVENNTLRFKFDYSNEKELLNDNHNTVDEEEDEETNEHVMPDPDDEADYNVDDE